MVHTSSTEGKLYVCTHTYIHKTFPAVLYSLVRQLDSCLGRKFPIKLIFHCIKKFHLDETVP